MNIARRTRSCTSRVAILAALSLFATVPSGAGSLTQAPCPGGPYPAITFAHQGMNVLENLVFADGWLWVSDATQGAVLQFAHDGTLVATELGFPSPGGLVRHPDGWMYVGVGNSLVNAASRSGAASVRRFQPSNPMIRETFASGFDMPNGMALLPNGDLAISNDLGNGLLRIPHDDPAAWAPIADVWGTNGLVVSPDGSQLYAAITFDQRSPIERIDLSTGEHETAVELTAGVVSLEPAVHTGPDTEAPLLGVKGLDDMTSTPDGTLYVVANGTGELLRVDPATGEACVVASGLQNPSSVRIAPEYGGGGFSDGDTATIDLFITEFSGAIKIVRAPA